MIEALKSLDEIAQKQTQASRSNSYRRKWWSWKTGTGFGGARRSSTELIVTGDGRLKAYDDQNFLDMELKHALQELNSNYDTHIASTITSQETFGLKWTFNYLLNNDSLLDIGNRVFVYSALFQLIRSACKSSSIVSSFIDQSLCSQLEQLSHNANTFLRLYEKQKTENAAHCNGFFMSNEILETYNLVMSHVSNKQHPNEVRGENAMQSSYLEAMQPLRFSAIEMADMIEEGLVCHYFLGKSATLQLKNTSGHAGVIGDARKRLARVACEMSGLSSSLPVELGSSIFVRCDESRMDILKALIVGPEGTPYANGLFEFDILLPPAYPSVPPRVQLVTTGGGTVRFNPNLYACGMVCLSLLGTWMGPGWDPKESTLLQVLVSIQSLILVPDPYYNEPSPIRFKMSPVCKAASWRYNANIRTQTVRYAIIDHMLKPSPVFKEVNELHFYHKRDEILKHVQQWGGDVLGVTAALDTIVKDVESTICKKGESICENEKAAEWKVYGESEYVEGGKQGKVEPNKLHWNCCIM